MSVKSLSPEEVADVLGCFDARWVTNKCREQELRAFKLGGRWRITPGAVVEYLQNSPGFENVEDEFAEALDRLNAMGDDNDQM